MCTGENFVPKVEIQNYGTNNLSSLTLELYEEGNTTAIQSTDWSGSLAPLAKQFVEFNSISNQTSNQNYTVSIITVNGNSDNFAE